MKKLYAIKFTSILTIFLACFVANKAYSQTLNIDTTSAKVEIVTATGTLGTGYHNYATAPAVIDYDSVNTSGVFTRQMRLAYNIDQDGGGNFTNGAKNIYSNDRGNNWSTTTTGIHFGRSTKKRNGQLMSLSFAPTYSMQHNPTYGYRNYPFDYATSTNNGSSWTIHTFDSTATYGTTGGLVHFNEDVIGIKLHKNLIEDSDGTMYVTAYVAFTADHSFSSMILKSTDGGVNWGPIYNGSTPVVVKHDNDEIGFTICANGDWLAVMKQSGGAGPNDVLPILYSRSTDKGLTWSTPAELPGLVANDTKGKNPMVMLMPDGVLVLSWGTPNTCLAFSANNGVSWSNLVMTFPDTGVPKNPSGNTWVTSITPNTVLQFGDYYSQTINPNTQGIWQKEVEIVRPEQNRIDLKTKYAAGAITISPLTTLISTFSNHPEANTTAPFDGSVNYWSSAMGTTSGVYELDLQQIYHLKTVGIALLNGTQESATVELSPDGSSWTNVKTYTSATHYCLDYTSFTVIDARYVRVTVTGTGQIGLGELELYQTASTFENNAASTAVHGILPPGYEPAGTSSTQYGVSVVKGGYGYQSDRAMKLYDGSSTWIAGVKKTVSASNTKTLEFRCRPAAIPVGGSFSWRILGTVSGNQSTVFFFAVFAESSGGTTTYKIKANNGSGWTQVGTATLPVSGSVWKQIKVTANESANTASLYVDGVLAGTTGMYANPANTTNLTGFSFLSNGTNTSGELVYFDDVDFYDTTVGPTQYDAVNTNKMLAPIMTDQPVASKAFGVSVSPNPSSNVIQVHVENGTKGPTTILITNMSGATVKKLTYNADTESSSVSTTVQGYFPGVYVITAKQNGQIAQTKLSVN